MVSEIAKRDGKSSVKSVVTSLAGKSVAAVMVAMVMCGGVASAATGTQYGTGATAAYNTSVAVGENAQATNSEVTLVGANSQIQGQYSSVVGINNKDYGVYGTSPGNNSILGSTNNVKGQHNIIVGNGTTISSGGNASSISSDSMGSYNVALGDNQSIGGDKNISILSDGYRLRGKQNISIGYGSKVGDSRNAEFSLAIGAASAQGNNTVAIGHSALAENVHNSDTSIAIGTLAQASDSIAIGSNSSGPVSSTRAYLNAQGSSVNIGFRNAQATNKSVILGSNNNYGFGGGVPVSTDGGVAIGHDNYISGAKNEVIIGSGNNTNGESQIAIGTNIQSNTHLGGVKGAVAIGYNSEFATLNKPSGTLNINGVNLDASNYAGNSSSLTYGNTFSIGKLNNERQLKNVAAGEISATSTDAINGSQLYEAVRAVTAGASPDVYMHVNDGTATQGAGNATSNLGKANEKGGATGNLAIAIGKDAKAQGNTAIAIGNSSTYANADSSIAMLGNVDSGSKYSVAIGTGTRVQGERGTALGMSASTYGVGATALGAVSYAGADGSVSLGYYNSAYAKNSVAIGSFAGTENTAENSVAIGYGASVNHHTKDAVAIGGARIGYFAMLGAGQEYSTSDNSNSIAIGNGVQVFSKNTVTIGSYDNRTRTLFHLAGSTIPWQTDQNKLITPVTLTRQHMYGGTDTGYTEGTLGNSVYLGHESYAFTPNPLVDDDSHLTGEQSIHTKKYDATGNIVVSNNTTGGAFGKVSKATINGDEITGFAGAQSVGAVTIGAGDYERRIQNVAAGEVSATSTDAINGSQLYAVANTFSKNMSSYMHVNDGTSTQTVGNATTNYGYSGSKAGATGTKAIAGGVNAQAAGEKAIAIGADATASSEAAIAIGKSVTTDSDSKNSIAMGNTSNVTGTENAVLLGRNSSITSSVPGGPATKISTSSIVIGQDSHITDSMMSVAIGSNANISQAHDGIAIGSLANITNSENAMALGQSAKVANASAGIAIGGGSEVAGAAGIAIGAQSKAFGESSISIGLGNEVKGNKSSAIGDPSYIDTTATGTHVHGNDNGTATNPIKASESTFMGNTNLAGTAGTTGIHVVGNNNTVDSSNVMVMGNNVTVGTGLDGAVVLGHASTADQYAAATDSTINGVTFEAAGYAGNTGLNKGSIVSVGATGAERQIKNVAAGAVTATSTDAVNGSQLYKTAETILKMPINMAGDSGDTVGLKLGKTVNIKGSVASGADVTDGNIAVVGDKATSTLSLKMAKNLTGLTSGTFTDATGNQTVINGAGVTVTPTGTGATPISITTSGINAGNQEIKGVKKGTTDDAAVNKKQMDDALAGISSTLTINDGATDGSVNLKTGKLKVVGESGANALVTTTVSGDTITVGTSTKLQNAVTAAEKSADKDLSNLSTTGSDKVKTLAQDAVKVAGTGLATVSDATAAGVKTYTVNVDEGKLVIDDTTGKIGANGATQGTTQGKNGVATTQDVASVVNSAIDKTKQALDDAKHNFAGDDATVISRKHGEQLNIKGGASTTATDLTSGNIAVVGDTTSGTLNIKMAKALTGLTSATYTDGAGNTQTVTGGSSTISDAAGNSTVVSKGGVTTTDGTNTTTVAPSGVTATDGTNTVKLTGSGIDAGNTQIKNVGKATTDDAAVNKKQMDDALKGATDNTVSLGSESGTTTAKKLSTTGGIKFNIKGETGANALITTSASGDDVTIAPTAKLTAAVTAAEKSADKDLSNLSAAGDTYIKNLAKTAASWNVETNGAGTTAVAGGDTVNFINGDNIAITNAGRSITIGTAKNVSFDKVTVGGIVLDKNTGINAGNKEIKGVANATSADAAVNKGQMDAAITAAAGGSLSTEKVVAKTLTGDNNLATVTGQTGTAKGETYEVSVSENAVKAVAATAAQDAVKVDGTGLATVSSATAAGVKTYTVNVDEGKLVIDDTTGKIGAAGASQGTTQGKNGVATTQDVASVVNSAIDKTKQALDDAKHNFAGDDATVISRKHGEQLNIKGGASTTATDLTSGNIAVVGDTTSGTLNIKMAKALTGLTSATYTDGAGNTQTVTGGSSTISDAAGNSTVVSKGGVTTTDGTNTTTVAPSGVTATDGTNTVKLTGSGIDAGNTQIKNVGKATTDDAAVNKKQMDDALKGATDNTVSLGSESGTTTAKKLSTTGGIKFNIKGETGANALITTSASGDDVTIAPTAKLTAAVTAAEKSADKDLSNLSAAGDTYIKNLAKTAASWNVETNGAGTTAVAGGDTVNFINGDNIAITNTGRSITIGTAKNVSFDKVTVGGIVLDKNTGINAGNKEIKGIADGTTADAAVNKGQMDAAITAAAGGSLSTEKVVAKTLTGDNNLATVTGQTGTAKGETYEVSVSENAVKAVAATAAQDAVKVDGTGLATVSSATAAGVKTYTVNVDEGKLVIDDTTGKIGATGATQGTTQGKDGVATTQNVASVVNSAIDKTKQALDDAKHNFAGDDATVISRKHGEQLNIKGGASTTATDLTSGNIAVVGDTTSGTLNIKMAKALTGLTSATYTDAAGNTQTVTGGSSTITDGAGNTTTITKGGMTTTDGTNTTTVAPSGVTATDGTNTVKLTGSGIDAGNTQIKNVGKATTDDAAVNKKQMDDAVKAATDSISTLGDNKVSLGSDSGTTTAKKLSTTGGIKFNIKGDTGANALISTSATGDDVTVAPTAKLTAAVTAAEKSADKDLSNLSAAGDTYIKNLAKTAASWNVETNGAGTTAVAGGDTVNFINGDNIAITNTGRSITIGTAKNVSFDKVTVGGIVLDKNTGINAGNKEIKGIADGTTADAAVNKGQMDAAITAAAGGSLSTEKVVAKTLTGDNNLATVTGQTGTAKGETYEVSVSENAVKAVAATAAQDAVKVDGTGLATVSSATAAGVKTYTVNVDEGKLVIDDTTGKIGAAGASQGTTQGKNGVATTQDVASVVNSAIDKTKQALDDAKHNFAGDDATVISRKHGEQLNIKGGASTTATDLTSGNIAVVGDTTSGTLNIKMAKALTGLTSATYTDGAGNTQTVTGGSSTITDGAGNTTTITKGGMTTTDGTNTTTVAPAGVTATDGTNTVKLNGSGIDAGNTQIKNVGKATTDDAAVNKKQMDDAVKAATDSISTLGDNKVSLGSDSGTTTAKKLSTTGGIKFNIKGDTGANALISTSATGDDVTIAPTAKLTAAVTAAEKSADKDLSNISPAGETVIKNLAATSAQDAVKVTGTGLATVSDSTTGGVKTYNVDVKTGNLVVTAAGQVGATGATGAGGATGADGVATTQNVATAINDAITKSKTDTAQAIADAEHKFDGDTGATSVRKHGEVLSIKGGVTNTADLATGNIGVVSDGAGTLNIRLAKVLSGLTSASFTNAGGDSTVINGNGVTITPSATGAAPISMTTAGINAGNKEIKGVATGTTADAAVNKAQMDAAITAAAGGSLSTEKVVAKTLTGDNNLATVTGQTGTAKGETYEVAVSENAVKSVAATAAQNAVKVTGTDLATVTDTTTGGVKTYNVDVKTGNLVVTAAGQAGATGTTGAGGAVGADGVATTQNVATAINDAITKSKTDIAQAIADAEHKFDGDTGATSVRKHGEVLSVKGGVTAPADLTTGNIGVVSDGAGTLNIRLAKVLSGLTSATYTDGAGNTQTVTAGSSTITDGAGNTTTITKGGMTTTDGTNTTTVAPAGVTATDGTNTVKLNGSGIDAGNTQIKNVGKATTDDAAVNKKQMDDAVKAATDSISTLGDNKVSLGSDSGTTTAKKLSTTGGIKFNIKGDTGANALISTSATGDDVTIAPTAKLTAAVTAAENSANKDLSNLSPAGNTYIQNLAKSAASWNVETNGAGTTAVSGGDTVNFINGDNIAITNAGRSITIGTARNVSFDKVTVGGVVIDKNNGIDAGGKEITNVGPATSGNSAVNKTQMDTAIANAQTAATSTEKVVAKTLTGDNNLVTVTGQTGTAKGETYEVAVSENAVKAVAQTAAQNAVKVTGTDLATVTDTTTGGVKTYNVDVKTGNLVVTAAGQVGAAGTTGAGGASGTNGVATTQNVASAINDAITKSKTDTAQAIANAEHKFDGDTGATSVRKHGEVLSVKGGVTNTADLTTGNIGVVSDGAGTLNIRLAKTLTGLTSAAFTDGTHTVTIAGSGIDAGNTEIKHVGKATTDDAAVNKKQMDDAVKAATDSVTTLGDNKVSLGSDSGTTTAKKLSTTGGIKFNIKGDTGANALITTFATGDDVTIAPTAKLSAAVTAAENSANKDLSNLSTAGNTYIQNLAKSAASWNVETNGAGTTAVSGGDTVNFINGDNIAITNTGRSITIGTAKNVSFDKVTVGGVVIDKNNGIDAGGKEITNVGPATSGNSAVNKTQMDTAITNAVNKATTDAKHDFGGDDTTVVTRKHGEKLNIKGGASTTAADLTSGNIAVLGDAATGTLNIRMAKALTGLSSATFTTPSGTTVINGGGMTITPASGSPISVTTGGINAGNTEIKNVAAGTTPNSAVNKQQMDSAISNATANVGFSTAGNTGTGSVTNGQTLTITGTNGIETSASGQSITVGLDAATRAQINNATTTANNAAKKDLSNIDNAGKQVIKDTAAWNVKVNGAAAETVKGGDTVTFKDGDNIKVTNTGKDITIATKKDVSFDKVTVGNVVIDKNTNRISGLANAANNDEAVNLGQMNAAISTATAGTGNIKYKANGGTQNSVALTTGFDFKGDSNIQITADPANSGVINYKLNPALTGITSISGGTGAPTITLNAGSGSTPGNVSINSNLDMGGKQINNIGAATHAGDAVNKAQMDQALQNIAGASSNAAKSYAYKAGAGAAALAALKPIQYDPLEPTQIMAGIGNYKSQTAVALGVAHYTNENTMFNLGVSLDSHDGIVNAGVTHKFGYGPEKKAIPDKYKGGPISSIYVMQDEVTALQAIVEKQAAENEALRQQNEDMQRKVDMILSKIH